MCKVLIVDDDKYVRGFLKEALKEHDIIEAGGVREAEKLYNEYLPDVVILDMCMPDGNGRSLLVENKLKDSTVIILTGVSLNNDEKSSLTKQGAFKILSKPVKISNLLSSVCEANEIHKNPHIHVTYYLTQLRQAHVELKEAHSYFKKKMTEIRETI